MVATRRLLCASQYISVKSPKRKCSEVTYIIKAELSYVLSFAVGVYPGREVRQHSRWGRLDGLSNSYWNW